MTQHLVAGGAVQSYLTFRVGRQEYAVDVLHVYEVSNLVAISEVADMPPSILGVVNIRGQVVPIIDLRLRFQIPEHALDLDTPIVFVSHESVGIYGIVVDDVDDVLNLPGSAIGQTTLSQRARHILGMTDYNGRIIMIVDPAALMHSTLDDEALQTLIEANTSAPLDDQS